MNQSENKAEFKRWLLQTFGREYKSKSFSRKAIEQEAEKASKPNKEGKS